MQSSSNKEAMWLKVVDNKDIETTSTINTRNNILSPKAAAFSKVLLNIGIVSTEDELPNEDSDKIDEDIITINPLKRGWASHSENPNFNLNDGCIVKLIELYDKGKGKNNKCYCVTTERAYDILRNAIIPKKRTQKKILTVPKVK